MRALPQSCLRLESLESRYTPAVFNWLGFGSTMQITQTQGAIGVLGIVDNVSSITVFDYGDNSTATIASVGFNDLRISLLGTDSALVVYELNAPRPGGLTLEVGNALPRTLEFVGGFPIGGSMSVTAGSGGLLLYESAPLILGGNLTFNGGVGFDVLALNNVGGTVVGGTMFLTKANIVHTTTGDVIGGTLSFNDVGGGFNNQVQLDNTVIGGDINYFGGNRGDIVALGGVAPVVGRNVTVNFASQLPTDTSILSQAAGLASIIGGSVNVQGGNLGTEIVVLSGVVGGSITINLNSGPNTVLANGFYAGTSFYFLGGVNVDTVIFAPLAGSLRTRFFASLGASNDVLLFLGGATNPSFASVDFGAGFDGLGGPINFPFSFLNLP